MWSQTGAPNHYSCHYHTQDNLITPHIPRVLGAVCQELGTTTEYLWLYHTLPSFTFFFSHSTYLSCKIIRLPGHCVSDEGPHPLTWTLQFSISLPVKAPCHLALLYSSTLTAYYLLLFLKYTRRYFFALAVPSFRKCSSSTPSDLCSNSFTARLSLDMNVNLQHCPSSSSRFLLSTLFPVLFLSVAHVILWHTTWLACVLSYLPIYNVRMGYYFPVFFSAVFTVHRGREQVLYDS